MAGLRRAAQQPRLSFIVCGFAVLLLLFSQALKHRRQENRHRRQILDSTETPAEHIDPAAIDLTPLVNALINSTQSGSRQLFSLLSVTSYSSLALHKLTLLVYNISGVRGVESSMFRRRFCYCVTNETNDLTDFAAVLLDVMGNSTSYLHELFTSSSIVSVSHRNTSDCIYICVMAGKLGREAAELWEVESITPLFNRTIVEGPHRGNISAFRLPAEWPQAPTNLSHISPSGMSSLLTSRVHAAADEPPTALGEAAPPSAPGPSAPPLAPAGRPTTATARSRAPAETATGRTHGAEKPTTALQLLTTSSQPTSSLPVATAGAPASPTRPKPKPKPTAVSPVVTLALLTSAPHPTQRLTSAVHPTSLSPVRPSSARWTTAAASRRTTTPSRPVDSEKPGCPWRRSGDGASGGTTTVSAHKLQPCVLELCKFFSQCLCRPSGHKTRMKRYCDDSHLWYEKHTSEICRRVRRISFSRSLKQRCLTKMCSKL